MLTARRDVPAQLPAATTLNSAFAGNALLLMLHGRARPIASTSQIPTLRPDSVVIGHCVPHPDPLGASIGFAAPARPPPRSPASAHPDGTPSALSRTSSSMRSMPSRPQPKIAGEVIGAAWTSPAASATWIHRPASSKDGVDALRRASKSNRRLRRTLPRFGSPRIITLLGPPTPVIEP